MIIIYIEYKGRFVKARFIIGALNCSVQSGNCTVQRTHTLRRVKFNTVTTPSTARIWNHFIIYS